jgi:hypothetical protein
LPETFSTKVQHSELKLFLKLNPYFTQILIGYFLKRLIVLTENSNWSLKHSILLNWASSMVKSFQHLTTFFMSTWWVNWRNMQEILFPQWLLEGRQRKNCCQMSWIGCFILKVAQKTLVRFQFLVNFCNSWKMLSNVKNTFCCISPL